MVTIKSKEHLDLMRKAGVILRDTLSLIEENAKIGVTTKELDKIAYLYIISQGGIPSFLNYNGYPASVCLSIDEEVVHGIPSDKKVLEEGMLLKIDCGVGIGGYHTDAARTLAIGQVSAKKRKLMEVCKQSFFEGMKVLQNGARLGTLGHAIQSYVESFGFSVVRDLTGHGIGTTVHEDPTVLNFGREGRGERVHTNMTICVEPMINMGSADVYCHTDGWTYVTKDGLPSAHYENTVIITDSGVEIITV